MVHEPGCTESPGPHVQPLVGSGDEVGDQVHVAALLPGVGAAKLPALARKLQQFINVFRCQVEEEGPLTAATSATEPVVKPRSE